MHEGHREHWLEMLQRLKVMVRWEGQELALGGGWKGPRGGTSGSKVEP